MPAKMYSGFRYLENGIDNGGWRGEDTPQMYKAYISLPDGSGQWITADTIQLLATKAYNIGMKNGPVTVSTIPTFMEYCESILARYKNPSIKSTTLAGYRSYCENHFYPYFGDKPISEITPPMIQDYLNSKKHLAKKTLKEHIALLVQIFDYAIAEKIIDDNPASNKVIVNPSKRVERRQSLTEEQIRSIYSELKYLKEDDARILAFLLFSGMRRGELIGLQRRDIDNDFLHINREVTYPCQNQPHIDFEGKTDHALRVIPIIDYLRPFIPDCDPSTYIFGMGHAPISLQQFRNTWARISKTIDIFDSTPHIYRHTFTTICNDAGLDLKSIKIIVGHSTTDITLGTYTHSMTRQLLLAGQKINSEFENILSGCEFQQIQA